MTQKTLADDVVVCGCGCAMFLSTVNGSTSFVRVLGVGDNIKD